MIWGSVLFFVITFLYFILANGERELPYIYNFMSTMNLLTHILLINVKIPGNAALFFNLVWPVFSFYWVPESSGWVKNWFNLGISPSKITVFLQAPQYRSTYMLEGAFMVYFCFFLLLVLMCFVPILKACERTRTFAGAGKWAVIIEKRVFWGITMRLIVESYLVLAVLSWSNMTNPTQNISTAMSVFNLIALNGFLAYCFYNYITTWSLEENNSKRKKVKDNFRFLQKIQRLKRGKVHPMIYMLIFLTRRAVLAMTFVFLHEYYALQVCIWLLLSLSMMFTIMKIRPFGDKVQNAVQFINECFIFVSGLIMLPLANILRDLNARDEAG